MESRPGHLEPRRPAVKRIVKRIAEAVSKRYFSETVLDAYRHKDEKSHETIKRMARRDYGMEELRPLKRFTSCLFMEFVHQVQIDLFHRGNEMGLGLAPIGFDDLKIHCWASDANSSTVYLYGFSDNRTIFDLYRQYALPGTAALDVGANLGIHSLVLSRCVGKRGAVFSYEPVESIHRRLGDNIRANGLVNIVTRSTGIGEINGEVGFDDHAGKFNIGKGRVQKQAHATIPVTTIDEEAEDLRSPVSLIKIDVEGYELSALRGARRTLERFEPALVLEFNPDRCAFPELVEAIPYRVDFYRIPYNFRETLQPVTVFPFHERADLLVVPRSGKPPR